MRYSKVPPFLYLLKAVSTASDSFPKLRGGPARPREASPELEWCYSMTVRALFVPSGAISLNVADLPSVVVASTVNFTTPRG